MHPRVSGLFEGLGRQPFVSFLFIIWHPYLHPFFVSHKTLNTFQYFEWNINCISSGAKETYIKYLERPITSGGTTRYIKT